MKIGCSSAGCIKKVDAKSRSPRPITLVCASVVLLLVLSLIGCGRLSLLNLLENEEPGAFSVIPKSAVVPADTTVEVSGKGGFKPYSYEKITGKGKIDPNTGVYVAPTSGEITGDSEDTQIMVSDALDSEATLTLTVYRPLTMNPGSKTIAAGDSITFTVSGGVPDPDYDFYVNDVWKASASPSWSYDEFDTEGTYMVEAVDSFDNRAAATIEAIAAGELGIDASPYYVEKNTTLTVTAINAAPPFTFSVDPAGVGSFVNPNVSPATYNAPGSEATVTISLTDNLSRTVSATVYVVDSEPDPLILSPSSVGVLGYGDDIVFTAYGGIQPYRFWAEQDDVVVDRVDQVGLPPHQARYTTPNFNTTNWFHVEDAVGETTRVKIRVQDD